METTNLKTMLRTESLQKTRHAGFTPGVLNSKGEDSQSVQFETTSLMKILSQHGAKARLWVDLDGDKKFGYIKEIQRNPVDRSVQHVAIQMVVSNQSFKMDLPLIFHGREALEHRNLQLHVLKSNMTVFANSENMPENAAIDVSEKNAGDIITSDDFHLQAGVQVLDAANESYAIVKAAREVVEEPEPAE